ncbi:MAG: c-type cytochrome [Chloroflexi bacterium]|nr:c-type cytochrome [Chloroflexota bacterium]
MNTGKQINVMLGLFMVFAVATLLYFLWDTPRQEEAIERQTMTNSERGAELFALNCRSCHGITGQGAIERGGLPGAPLNLEAMRESSAGALGALQQRLNDTITCGRIGTVMPSWSQDQGGPLNFFQIEQLVTLITGSKPVDAFDPSEDPNAVSEFGWEIVWEEANHADEFSPRVELDEAIGVDATAIPLNDVSQLKHGDILRLGGSAEEPVYELVAVSIAFDEFDPSTELVSDISAVDTTLKLSDVGQIGRGDVLLLGSAPGNLEFELVEVEAIDEETGQITVERGAEETIVSEHSAGTHVLGRLGEMTVERGAEGTKAMEHPEGTDVFGNFVPPGTTVTGDDDVFVCGQTAGAGGDGNGDGDAATVVAVAGSADVSMGDNFFEVDGETNPTLEVGVGESITFEVVNNGVAIHNMRIAGVDNEYDSEDDFVSVPDFFAADDKGTLTFTFDEAGTFNYRCDFHQTEMLGQISVVE